MSDEFRWPDPSGSALGGRSAGQPASGPGEPGQPPPQMPGGFPEDAPVFVISVAAQLSGMHPQTLRQYDRLGLVNPGRTPGGGRRYSARDVLMLREVARLTHEEGVNLAGVKRIIELTAEVAALRERVAALAAELEAARREAADTAAAVHASYRRDLVPVRPSALVIWRPQRRRS